MTVFAFFTYFYLLKCEKVSSGIRLFEVVRQCHLYYLLTYFDQ